MKTIVNKRIGRWKQWSREKMGAEIRTGTSEEIKSLEIEMDLRCEGMKRLMHATSTYHSSISKRVQDADKSQRLPAGLLGTTMITHANDFEADSEFGQCLVLMGKANEGLAHAQATHAANVMSSWLESTEQSLVQMKEYQDARKKLDQRRLAHDTAARMLERDKKDDYRLEEQAFVAKQKWEESRDDVYLRMLDIRESEKHSVEDLWRFLDVQLAYHERCRQILLQTRHEWSRQHSKNLDQPSDASTSSPSSRDGTLTESSSEMASVVPDHYGATRRANHYSAQSPVSYTQQQKIPAVHYTRSSSTPSISDNVTTMGDACDDPRSYRPIFRRATDAGVQWLGTNNGLSECEEQTSGTKVPPPLPCRSKKPSPPAPTRKLSQCAGR